MAHLDSSFLEKAKAVGFPREGAQFMIACGEYVDAFDCQAKFTADPLVHGMASWDTVQRNPSPSVEMLDLIRSGPENLVKTFEDGFARMSEGDRRKMPSTFDALFPILLRCVLFLSNEYVKGMKYPVPDGFPGNSKKRHDLILIVLQAVRNWVGSHPRGVAPPPAAASSSSSSS